ncbi:MAG: restriction endonuclease subunit S [Alistipes sp.]|nr:restriction endonuclease subunit S [Alistipes sp.]
MTTKNNIPAGYKDSAVGIIPQEWEVTTLGKLVSITSGESPSLYNLQSSGKYPYVKVEDMNNCEKYQVFSREYSDDEKGAIPKGSIIFPKRGAAIINNKVRIADCALYMDSNMMAITPNEYVCGDYLYFKITFEKLYKIADTSTIPQINNKHIIPYKLAVPPMGEQRKIAEILGVWDEAIEKQSRLIERLEVRKRALMQRLLTGRVRLSGFTTPWQKIKLGEIGKFEKGAGVPKDKITSSGCKAITYGEIYTKYNYVINNFASYIDEETARESKQISSGVILFAGSGETLEDIGKCVAFIDNDKAYAGGDIIIFNPTIEVDSLVLSYILNSPIAIAQKRRYGQGHSVVHIYQKDLARIEFELPSLPEQKAIAEVLTTADNEIAIHRKKLDALRIQKRGLMQQLLTGITRVKIQETLKL